MGCITTFTGKRVDPLAPTAEVLLMEDIAHALSLLCRGNGHVKFFYSVAQHSIACAKEAEACGFSSAIRLACLLHDGAEAYLCDVPSPMKAEMPFYRAAEARLLEQIFVKFIGRALSAEEWASVRAVDRDMLGCEFHFLMPHEAGEWNLVSCVECICRPPSEVESEFLRLAGELAELCARERDL